ncbi:UNVERIFIED_CONTAM: hypothetical protein GTU68_044996 [Idotea baltica]|nr:hypothetical protein [Idotea baltica]
MSKRFSDLGINEQLQQGLTDLQISVPSDIQEQTIPVVLNQKEDVVALAKTGTGKTAAFGLPLLQLIDVDNTEVQAIILTPTRELGQQIHTNLVSFSTHIPSISIATVCGGIPIKPQIERLKSTTHIVVATPGRLADLVKRQAINIANISYFVLDEADEMVSALKDGLDAIIKDLPKSRRTLLFTATMPGTNLAARGLDIKDISYVVNYHLPDTYDNYVHRSGRTARAGAKGLALTILQQEEVFEVPEFEEELGIVFNEYKKADTQIIEENKTLLWAKKIFKTKPNRTISEELRKEVRTVFHHLTKEELIEKVLANYITQTPLGTSKLGNSNKEKNKK